jgi:tRNA G26 N,N-dimethylase Trm1
MMVEVFKTNVTKVSQAKKIVSLLLEHFPNSRINFDLHDCDKVLRVKGENFKPEKVMMLVKENGFMCNVLE